MASHGLPEKTQLIALQALCHLCKDQRQAALHKADFKTVRCICGCVLNILRGSVPLSGAHKQKLKRHAPLLRRLASGKGSSISKKKVIIREGGFLPLLLAPIIGSLISNLINR